MQPGPGVPAPEAVVITTARFLGSVQPGPGVRGQVALVESRDWLTLQVFTVQGRLVGSTTLYDVPAGLTDINLPVWLPGGLYFVRAVSPQGPEFVQKIVLMGGSR